MAETPKSVLRRLTRRSAPAPMSRENPKTVFRRMVERQRRAALVQQEQSVLALCARAAQEADPDRRLAMYEATRRYDLHQMTPQVRDIVWELLRGIVEAHQTRQNGVRGAPHEA